MRRRFSSASSLIGECSLCGADAAARDPLEQEGGRKLRDAPTAFGHNNRT